MWRIVELTCIAYIIENSINYHLYFVTIMNKAISSFLLVQITEYEIVAIGSFVENALKKRHHKVKELMDYAVRINVWVKGCSNV